MDFSNRPYFSHAETVEEYAEAVAEVGLWVSEEKVFQRVFRPDDQILELGCGAGRIAIGLWELGYRKVFATDVARPMIEKARALCALLEYDIALGIQDATRLQFGDATFDGAIFGFNGLMMIPGVENRRTALREVARVLRPGGSFVFTGHDRTASAHRRFWEGEARRWAAGETDSRLEVFGDRLCDTPQGERYIHVATVEEVEELAEGSGLKLEASALRSELAVEPPEVEAFSDDTRFYVMRKDS